MFKESIGFFIAVLTISSQTDLINLSAPYKEFCLNISYKITAPATKNV